MAASSSDRSLEKLLAQLRAAESDLRILADVLRRESSAAPAKTAQVAAETIGQVAQALEERAGDHGADSAGDAGP